MRQPEIEKVKKVTTYTSDEIYNILSEEIISLKLKPGELISETEIAKRFNVSRTPVRDVFKKLAGQKFIEILPQRHTRITPINLKDVSSLMFIREKLEVGLLEDAIENVKKLHLLQVKISLAKQKKLIEDSTIETQVKAAEFLALDNEFHQELIRLSARGNALNIFHGIVLNYLRFRNVSAFVHDSPDLEAFYGHHVDIVNALENKDIDTIRATYKSHIYSGTAKIPMMLETLPEYFI